MAANKKTSKKTSKTKGTGKTAVKKVAKGMLGKIAQRGAQLILDSGVLGKPPRRKAAKKTKSRQSR